MNTINIMRNTDSKKEKIKQIFLNDCGGRWIGSQQLLNDVIDNICCQLYDIADDYEELLYAYIRL